MYILSVFAVALFVALMLVFLRTCGPQGATDGGDERLSAEEVEQGYVSPYDWDKLDRTDGRFAYVEDGKVKSHLGIDVSENQHEIDWQAVAEDGIDFAIVRVGYRGATEGDLYSDELYQDNLDGAKAAGIDCGAYFFSQATSVKEAVEEADYVVELLDGRKLEYPVAFDSEAITLSEERGRTVALDNDTMTSIAEAFCKRMEEKGYRTMVYGNIHDMSRYHYQNMQDDAIWWAEYDSNIPSAPIDIVMWQYSSSGEVAGIPTAVDMNIDLSDVLG